MADKMPNYIVEIKRLEVEIQTLELNLTRNELKVMELENEIVRIKTNDDATRVSIKEYKEKLKILRGEHLGDNDG